MGNFRALLGLAVCGVMASLMTTAAFAQDKEPIKIGFVTGLSGWLAAYDDNPHKAAILKIEEINKAGGLLGRQIEYKVLDMKTDLALSGSTASELVSWGANMMIVPPDYDYGSPAALIAQNAGLVAISTGASDPKMGVQGVGPYVFTAHTAGQTAGIVMAEYGQAKLGLKSAFILEDVSIEATKSSCAGFANAWERKGGTIVDRDTFKNDDPSISAQITRIKGLHKQPDAIFLCSYTPGGASAVRQLRAAGIDTVILSDTGMSGNSWLNAVPNLKDFYLPSIMSLNDDPRPEINKFLEAYSARWGQKPETEFSVLGYCAIEQWASAVQKANAIDSQPVVDVMNNFKDEPTTCGPTSYTSEIHIQVNRPQLIMKVENGVFKAVESYRNDFVPDLNMLLRKSK
ncbi:ABC transporter substrate-binding protein [Mesorhizobium sp. M3A.F.Ca.ET.080.04.2.1]|nr:ABC transporter substrate-binding protein [Mesorhizobium sp. M3A.F.Ca.ET.080.04.2.1]RWF18735.1 MAG: ABC transporter substrate-binding protein [Mesorhizobium sp.]